MATSDLYLDKIDLARYLSEDECRKCGAQSCKDLVSKLGKRQLAEVDITDLPPE